MHRPTPNALIAPPVNQVHREQYDATLVTKGSTVRFLEPRASNARKEHFKNNFKNPVCLAKLAQPGTRISKREKVRARTKVSKNRKIAILTNTSTTQTMTQQHGNALHVRMVLTVNERASRVHSVTFVLWRVTGVCHTSIPMATSGAQATRRNHSLRA